MSVKKSIPKRSQKKKKTPPITRNTSAHHIWFLRAQQGHGHQGHHERERPWFSAKPNSPTSHANWQPGDSWSIHGEEKSHRDLPGKKKHLKKIAVYKWFFYGEVFLPKLKIFVVKPGSKSRFTNTEDCDVLLFPGLWSLTNSMVSPRQNFAPLRFPGETSWIRRTFLGEISKEWCNDRFRIYFHGRISSFETET